jgi:hypothetical protein
VHSFVELGDGLAEVVPAHFSAFQGLSFVSGLTDALSGHAAAQVFGFDAVGAVVSVSEEGDHVSVLLGLMSLL